MSKTTSGGSSGPAASETAGMMRADITDSHIEITGGRDADRFSERKERWKERGKTEEGRCGKREGELR